MPTIEPQISIVLCTCNRARMLEGALSSLVQQETGGRFAYDILIVDDGSTDDTSQVAARAQAMHASVRYFYKAGGGVADARNFGVRHARGEWIAFFDDDQLAEPDWLAALWLTAQEHAVRCVGGAIALRWPGDALALGVRLRGLLGEHGHTRPIERYSGWLLPNTGNVLIHKSLFAELGYFDLSLREGGEDTDFFYRVQQAGNVLMHSPAAVVWHLIPAERLRPDYFRWAAQKGGVAAVRLYHKAGGHLYVLLHLVANWLLLVGREVLSWLCAYWRGEIQAAANSRCAFDYALGYTRACLRHWLPGIFQQPQFMKYVDFRLHGGERSELSSSASPASQQSSFKEATF